MSERFPGGIITNNPATPTGPFENGTAPGIWTLDQQLQYQQQGIWPTAGLRPNYIEDAFNTGLYSATGGSETFSILGSVDMYTKGGLVWIKPRNDAQSHSLIRPTLPAGGGLFNESNTTAGNNSFDSSEFRVNSNNTVTMANGAINSGGINYVSWNFAKTAKFFDAVTYTGNGTSSNAISHNLQSVPGCIIVKATSTTGDWWTFVDNANSPGSYFILKLNTTAAAGGPAGGTNITSSSFNAADMSYQAATNYTTLNASGVTYVAYLFANNAGGFGLSGTDNVITCGRFTTDGSGNATVSLGYEPQWILTKRTDGTGPWGIYDTMRGWSFSAQNFLLPNTSGAEGTINASNFVPTATGFNISSPYDASATYIYIAIRRGPMRTPTTGTSVFSPNATTATVGTKITTNFPVDLQIRGARGGSTFTNQTLDRLRGVSTTSYYGSGPRLFTQSTAAEAAAGSAGSGWDNTGFLVPGSWSGGDGIYWNFQRAPGFFDEVCYTNPPSSPVDQTRAHNLGVVPTLVISKGRNQAGGWIVLLDSSILGSVRYLQLNTTGAALSGLTYSGTATQYTTSFLGNFNETRVDYLFASCPGVSKVGSYTGTGTTQTINCGFTAGSRFVLIKRTDSTGDWYVWDSARGIVAGNDPYLLLNSTAAEVTNTDFIDTASTGFEISSTAPAAINASGGTFIFLAIA